MSTIRSIEEIIKQDAEKKHTPKQSVEQNFHAEVGNVINAQPGSTINIDQSKKKT